MNEQLFDLLYAEWDKMCNVLCVEDSCYNVLDDEETKCHFCAFATKDGQCGSPWSPAEVHMAGNIDPCYEGVWFASTGLPGYALNKLLLEGKKIPFLRLSLVLPFDVPNGHNDTEDIKDVEGMGDIADIEDIENPNLDPE